MSAGGADSATDGDRDQEDQHRQSIESNLGRRTSFGTDGQIAEFRDPRRPRANSGTNTEPSYYARERILFHLGRLLKDFVFFSELELELQAQLPEVVSYAFYPADSVFFHEGDVGDQCFILLTGQADVWKSNDDGDLVMYGGSVHSNHPHQPLSPSSVASHHSRMSRASTTANVAVCAGAHAIQRKCTAIAHMLVHVGSHPKYESDAPASEPASPLSPTVCDANFSGMRRPRRPSIPVNLLQTLSGTVKQVSDADQGEGVTPQSAQPYTSEASPTSEAVELASDEEAAEASRQASKRSCVAEAEESVEPQASPPSAEAWQERGEALAARKSLKIDCEVPNTTLAASSDETMKASQSEASDAEEDGFGDEYEEPWWKTDGTRVASLGAASLFGEVALLQDQPRNATVAANRDCEVLTITKSDFDSILKTRMREQKMEKLGFLRRHVPGMVHLTEKQLGSYAYLFKPVKFPKGHFFVTQGGTSEGGLLHFLVKGSVEFRMESLKNAPVFSGLPEVGHRRLGCLAPGGMFGCLSPNRYEPFSVVATTSPCDVYRLLKDDIRRLPEEIRRDIRDALDHQNTWRIARCDSPAGCILGIVPKTLPSFQKGRRSRPRKMLPVDLLDSIAEFQPKPDMAPGEIIALKGKLPRMVGGSHSKSAPVLALGGRPTSSYATSSRPTSSYASGLSRPMSSTSNFSRPTTTPLSSMFGPL